MSSDRQALEAAILAEPRNPECYLVYADYLQSQGDPWGELIALDVQRSQSGEPSPAHDRRILEILEENHWFLPAELDPKQTLKHRWWGFVTRLQVGGNEEEVSAEFDAAAHARTLFGSPQMLLFDDLDIALLRPKEELQPAATVLEEAVEAGHAPRIRRLNIGLIAYAFTNEVRWGDLRVVGREFPGLSDLIISGRDYELGTLPAPEIESITIMTMDLSRANLRAIIGEVTRENLKHLHLQVGGKERGSEIALDDLGPILEGSRFPRLESLTLASTDFALELLRQILDSPVLPRLKHLGLPMSVLDDDGARFILEQADALMHLDSLNLAQSYFSDALCDELERVLGRDRVHTYPNRTLWEGSTPEPDYYEIPY